MIPKFPLGQFALGDVQIRRQDELASGDVDRAQIHEQGAGCAVSGAGGYLRSAHLAAPAKLAQNPFSRFFVLGQPQLDGRLQPKGFLIRIQKCGWSCADHLVGRVAQHLGHSLIDEEGFPLDIRHPYPLVRRFKYEAVPFFTLPQGFLILPVCRIRAAESRRAPPEYCREDQNQRDDQQPGAGLRICKPGRFSQQIDKPQRQGNEDDPGQTLAKKPAACILSQQERHWVPFALRQYQPNPERYQSDNRRPGDMRQVGLSVEFVDAVNEPHGRREADEAYNQPHERNDSPSSERQEQQRRAKQSEADRRRRTHAIRADR